MRSELRDETLNSDGAEIGIGLILPGLIHWRRGRRERALILGGGFLSFLTLAALGWGSTLGLAMYGAAFAIHVASMRDVFRQSLFPGVGRFAPTILSAGVIGFCGYLPVLLAASAMAWPGRSPEGNLAYLVDRWAFNRTEPARGDRVWLRARSPRPAGPARIIATGGQEISWADRVLVIDGVPHPFKPFTPSDSPESLAFRVPDGHFLVGFEGAANGSDRWRLIARDDVRGRAWARTAFPGNRRLLD